MSDDPLIIQELLKQRTPVVFRAGGPSMNPTIRDGESVRIRPQTPDDLRRFNILLVRLCGRMVLHRLLFRPNPADRCFIAGDAATEGGDWISSTDILGVAEWVRRGDHTRRLDSIGSRMAGRIRFMLRPLRRLMGIAYRRVKRHS